MAVQKLDRCANNLLLNLLPAYSMGPGSGCSEGKRLAYISNDLSYCFCFSCIFSVKEDIMMN